jgi:peptidoglycan/LPS O-acetylase OafA/YrhL
VQSAAAGRPRERLRGLDGVRGLAALFVVVHHVFERAFPGYPADRAPFWAAPFIYGRFAVVVFIVLSGFSLALSPARDGWRLNGLRRFATRRARRILPAFWAALVFSVLVAWLLVPPPGEAAPGIRSIVVNGLLVQNLVAAPSPNRSFWSLAVEAQLYLVLPLLLVLVRRRGAPVMATAVTLVVAAIGILGEHVPRVEVFVVQSPPDMAALFAVGVLAAGIVTAGEARRSWPWPALVCVAAAPVLAVIGRQGSRWTLTHLLWVDLALGPAVGCLLAALATGRPAALLRALEARPVRTLGLSSYSLYLTHGPIVVVAYELVVGPRLGHGPGAFLATVALAVPLAVAFAWLFASVFERSAGLVPRRQGVAQQDDIADLRHLGERRAARGVPGKAAVAHKPRSLRVAHEHGSDNQLQFIHKIVGQELRVHVAAAFDHQPLHAASRQVAADLAHIHRVAAVYDRSGRLKPGAGILNPGAPAVHQLLDIPRREEPRVRVELAAAGDGHLDRGRLAPARRPLVPTGL